MKYYIVEGTFAKPIEQYSNIEELAKGHFAFSERGIQEGWMLFGGPKLPGGGFFLVKAETLEIAKTYFEEDPFHTGGVNIYEFKELSFHDVQDCLKQWIE